ncbi:MAG: hypothetical protein WC568_10840 [Candidatus Methanoperedens sp.]
MPRREGERGVASGEKEIFMRARAGNLNISFSTEEEAQKWEDQIVSKLKDDGYKVGARE